MKLCEICGAIHRLEVHHIVSRGMGGSSRPEIEAASNKITICRSCHTEITEHRWNLTRNDHELLVTSVATGETVARRAYDSQFDAPAYFHRLTLLDLELDSVMSGIPYLTDEQLVELYASLRGLGKTAWKAQSAILWEAKQRSVHGDRAWEAMGRTFGIGWQYAYKLARVFETFFKGSGGDFSHQSENSSLPEVTWYVLATETNAPHFWLGYAEDQKAIDPSYSIADFKAEIRDAGARVEPDSCGTREQGKRCRWLRAYCTKLDRVVTQGECEGCDVLPSIPERLR